MSTIFSTLCDFFGLSPVAPTTFGDLLPWLAQIVLAVCVLWAIFRLFRAIAAGVTSGGRRL